MGRVPPSGAHAETRRPLRLGLAGKDHDLVFIHERLSLHPGGVMRALRAISAVLRTPPGLDGKQSAHLHLIGTMELTMDRLRLHKKVQDRLLINRGDLGTGPVRTHGRNIISRRRVYSIGRDRSPWWSL